MAARHQLWKWAGIVADVRSRLVVLGWALVGGAAIVSLLWVFLVHRFGLFGTGVLIVSLVLLVAGVAGLLGTRDGRNLDPETVPSRDRALLEAPSLGEPANVLEDLNSAVSAGVDLLNEIPVAETLPRGSVYEQAVREWARHARDLLLNSHPETAVFFERPLPNHTFDRDTYSSGQLRTRLRVLLERLLVVVRQLAAPASPLLEESAPLLIASERDAANAKTEKLIRRGEEIEASFIPLPSREQMEGASADWMKSQLLLLDLATKEERREIGEWHQRVIRELREIGGGALGLYSSREPLSNHLLHALHENRRFLRERLDELRLILGRIGVAPAGDAAVAARVIRSELMDARRKASTYANALDKLPASQGLHYETGFRFETRAWRDHAPAIAAYPNAYPLVEAAYQEIGRANDLIGWRATAASGIYGVNREEDDLHAVVKASQAGIEALNELEEAVIESSHVGRAGGARQPRA